MIITFVQPDGAARAVCAAGEESVMRVARDHDIFGIVAECGGILACATCHVVVADAWIDELPPPTASEVEMLDCVSNRLPGSRLSCQLKLVDVPDGLVVFVPESQF
jgi:ferredoxin, 2Fe-2S